MKTAVSLTSAIFEEAERVAKRRGLSRSESMPGQSPSTFRGNDSWACAKRLDAVHAASPDESMLDAVLEQLQALSMNELSPER